MPSERLDWRRRQGREVQSRQAQLNWFYPPYTTPTHPCASPCLTHGPPHPPALQVPRPPHPHSPTPPVVCSYKLKWLLDSAPDVAAAAAEGRCMFGTVDSWLIYNLTGGWGGRFCVESLWPGGWGGSLGVGGHAWMCEWAGAGRWGRGAVHVKRRSGCHALSVEGQSCCGIAHLVRAHGRDACRPRWFSVQRPMFRPPGFPAAPAPCCPQGICTAASAHEQRTCQTGLQEAWMVASTSPTSATPRAPT